MSRKPSLIAFLTFALVCSLSAAFQVKIVEASGSIYIKADGSVDPLDAPIQRNGDIYTLTGSISSDMYGIVIERNNMTLDGAGYTVQCMHAPSDHKGIYMSGISNVTIKNIKVKAFYYGIWLDNSHNNIISGNSITASNRSGIYLYVSSNNKISGNNITANNEYGICLVMSLDNNVSGNSLKIHDRGLYVYGGGYHVISGNNITSNKYGIWIDWTTQPRTGDHPVTITGNNITSNGYGIIFYSSSRNKLYHNNFIDNTEQVNNSDSTNVWDNNYPSGGNYWSSYNGTDQYSGQGQDQPRSDGLGDNGYMINGNNDRFPLMAPISIFDAGTWNDISYSVDVVSNSTVSDFYFNPDESAFLRFDVTGENGTLGFCRVTIPKDLLWVEDGWKVYLTWDYCIVQANHTAITDEHCTYMYFTYNQSRKTVEIQGTHVIPEFPSFLILPLFMTATLLAVIVYRLRNY